jgi:hypothetical protein
LDDEWKILESDIAELLRKCENEEDKQVLLQNLAPIRRKLSEVQNKVHTKVNAQKMWLEHAEACIEAQDKISQLEECLSSGTLTPEKVAELTEDLHVAREQLKQLHLQQAELEAELAKADIVFTDCSTGKVVDMKGGIQQLMADLDKGGNKLKIIDRALQLESQLQEVEGNLSQTNTVSLDNLAAAGSVIQVSL